MTSHPWFHPASIYAAHQEAVDLAYEVVEAAVRKAIPDVRSRHPLPEAYPGELLSVLVRDEAVKLALSSAFHGQTLRPVKGHGLGLHLYTPDDLLRIRTRKMPDPDQPVPAPDQLELELGLFPEDFIEPTLFGDTVELALLWAVKGDALYRLVLAAVAGFDDETVLSTWYAAIELRPPVVRRLPLLTAVGGLVGVTTNSAASSDDQDDLDDVIKPRRATEEEVEASGEAR